MCIGIAEDVYLWGLFMRSSMNAKVKKRPSMAALLNKIFHLCGESVGVDKRGSTKVIFPLLSKRIGFDPRTLPHA